MNLINITNKQHLAVIVAIAAVLILMLMPDFVFAGEAMPWDSNLTKLQKSLTGPVALAISIVAIVGAGATLIFGGTEVNGFIKTMLFLALVIAIIVGASSLASTFGAKGSGATINTEQITANDFSEPNELNDLNNLQQDKQAQIQQEKLNHQNNQNPLLNTQSPAANINNPLSNNDDTVHPQIDDGLASNATSATNNKANNIARIKCLNKYGVPAKQWFKANFTNAADFFANKQQKLKIALCYARSNVLIA